jgi:hypothetical protein
MWCDHFRILGLCRLIEPHLAVKAHPHGSELLDNDGRMLIDIPENASTSRGTR